MIIPQFAPKGGLESSVRALFAAGEQGAFYDPSDWATLFTDAAGTTPVTAVEQPVSLMLDKSKGGVGTNGAKRVNLLTYTEQFDNAAWEKLRTTIVPNIEVAPDGTLTADKCAENTAVNNHYIESQIITIPNASPVVGSIYLKAAERTRVYFQIAASGSGNGVSCVVNLLDGTFITNPATFGSGWSNASGTIISKNDNWYQIILFGKAPSTVAGLQVFLVNSGTNATYAGDGTSGIYIWGADLRLASEASTLPTYQRITDTWYNTQAGNHAYTPSTATASRPVLSARVNLLTKTEQFDDAAWTKTEISVSANTTATTDPLGTNTADKLIESSASNVIHFVRQTQVSASANTAYTVSVYAKAAERSRIILTNIDALSPNNGGAYAVFNLSTGNIDVAATTYGSGFSSQSASITDVGGGWYRCSVTATATYSTRAFGVTIDGSTSGALNQQYTGNGTNGVYIWGADLRVANDGVGIPSYQRVNTSTDYDTVGFPMYLKFDKSDDYMLTNAIDFSGGDSMTVAAALRKDSDAALGVVAELSATIASNNGTFLLSAPNSAAANFNYSSKGTTAVANTVTIYNAPVSAVIVADSDISSDSNNIRINGSAATAATSDQGSGNYGNYAMYLGRRGGTSDAFGGRLYGTIIRAAASSQAQINGITSYLNSKSKIFESKTTEFSADYLVVAGGGGGGKGETANSGDGGGGGGAGGYRSLTSQTISTATAYTITVGAGGNGSTNNSSKGSNGFNSVFSTTTSTGGGGGGSDNGDVNGINKGADGGSGGGAASYTTGGAGESLVSGGTGTFEQGNNGGSSAQSTGTTNRGGGGGGGASAAGNNNNGNIGGGGGAGTASSISGLSVTYAGGGGGGGGGYLFDGGIGGSSVGGNGSASKGAGGTSDNGGNGATSKGGGGGGSGGAPTSGLGGNGGSGVVIIKIPNTYTATFSGGVTASLSTAVAGYNIYTVTATSTTSETVTFA